MAPPKKTPTAKKTPARGSARYKKALTPELLDAEPEKSEDNQDLDADSDAEAEPIEVTGEVIALDASTDVAAELPEDLVKTRAISPADPLRRYFDEVKRHPMLDADEERALALKLASTGDLEAAKRLVTANLRLVVKIAMEYRSFYTNVLDLIQEGNVGLMKAVSKYDPTKGARLGYYASWWIRSYILKYLLDNFRLVKIGTTQAQKKLFYHLMREKERLEAQGLLAGPKLLAERLDVREKDVIEMQQRLSGSGGEVSLDAPMGGGRGSDAEGASSGSHSHLEFMRDEHELPDSELARNQLITLIKTRMPEFEKLLSEKELRLLHDRILSDEPKTLQEVADNYQLTRERARQIEAKVIVKLREFLNLGKDLD